MSAEAMGWVWKNSPYTGTNMVLHLAVADIANDTHDYRVWISTATLADKARTSKETASRWLWKAVEDGLLEVVDDRRDKRDGQGRRVSSEFRFLMPADARTGPAGDENPRAPVTTDQWSDLGAVDERSMEPLTRDQPSIDDRSTYNSREKTQERVTPDGVTRLHRKRDLLWDSLVDVCGLTDLPLTPSERGRVNGALKQLREVNATPEEIRRRASLYREMFPRASLTPTGLAANWSTVVADSASAPPNRPPLIADLLVDEPPRNRAGALAVFGDRASRRKS